jgi:hypothetical protein
MSKALELSDSLCRMDTFTEYQRSVILKAAAELRRLAALERAIKDAQPVAWESFCVLDQKARYSNLPIQSLQPGVYKHTPLYTLKGIKP